MYGFWFIKNISMKSGFGLVVLLLALAIVGLLVKKQMTATPQVLPPVPGASAPSAPTTTTVQQSQQMQQQVKQAVEGAMQSRLPVDDK